MGRPLQSVVGDVEVIFEQMIKEKMKRSEAQRFLKDWTFEAATRVYGMVKETELNMIGPPTKDIAKVSAVRAVRAVRASFFVSSLESVHLSQFTFVHKCVHKCVNKCVHKCSPSLLLSPSFSLSLSPSLSFLLPFSLSLSLSPPLSLPPLSLPIRTNPQTCFFVYLPISYFPIFLFSVFYFLSSLFWSTSTPIPTTGTGRDRRETSGG